jgi:hypothetical protein
VKTTDEDNFLREIAHVQLMHREHYRQECAKRHSQLTSDDLLPCEKFSAKLASEQLEREQEHERKARLARQTINECEQEAKDKEADEAAFWKLVYVLVHVAAAALVLFTLIYFWGK